MKRVINFWSLLGFISVAVFLASEIAAAGAAVVWSISSLFGLGMVPTIVLGTLVGVPSLYGLVKATVMAFQAETDPENN
ncbi:hypothetical protein GGD81_001601 [Rhodobium orientis]|uniref:Uncharacterized protein n=1 Tax=Rhodobium orientis TaxID=34017 RepID=A0A327JRN6_9HYPH|nr:hypothetical protein [Rhodobium orientis]MBB4302571.1 hypothetical protein [Rhodobium orientis]MBK5949419.1 hypothetical protein [Rhodobium orientis]RAI29149.1 hypothetical protein CH339_04080 [Rhodobium orientis]